MNVIRGDLIQLAREGVFDVVVHGCNCQCVMGAGIAKAIRAAFPAAWQADQATRKGDRSKLGTFSFAAIRTGAHSVMIVNAYTQFHWRGRPPLVDYDALAAAFAGIRTRFPGLRIGYPRIGAGLAGGDWQTIAAILDRVLAGEHHTLVEYGG